jgi:hypothetical protein
MILGDMVVSDTENPGHTAIGRRITYALETVSPMTVRSLLGRSFELRPVSGLRISCAASLSRPARRSLIALGCARQRRSSSSVHSLNAASRLPVYAKIAWLQSIVALFAISSVTPPSHAVNFNVITRADGPLGALPCCASFAMSVEASLLVSVAWDE